MSFEEAIATQPYWITIWLNWLLFGAFLLPVALLIWRPTRVAAIVTVAASIAAGLSISWLYDTFGYVKLIGAPHLVFWIPLAFYLYRVLRKPDVTRAPRVILSIILGTILVSLAFDIVDVARYVLGERAPLAGTS